MLKQSAGLSLIEILITVAILAIISAIGIPSYTTYVTNSRVHSVSADIRNGLQQARMEAIKRNATTSFCITSSSGSGWKTVAGNDCSTGTQIASKTSSGGEVSDVEWSPGTLSVSFGADGRIRTASGSATGTGLTTIDVYWKKICAEDCVRTRVEISPGGMIRSCNLSLADGDPQACATTNSSSSSSSTP